MTSLSPIPIKADIPQNFRKKRDQTETGNSQITAMRKVIERLKNAVSRLEQNQTHIFLLNMEVESPTKGRAPNPHEEIPPIFKLEFSNS